MYYHHFLAYRGKSGRTISLISRFSDTYAVARRMGLKVVIVYECSRLIGDYIISDERANIKELDI